MEGRIIFALKPDLHCTLESTEACISQGVLPTGCRSGPNAAEREDGEATGLGIPSATL